MYRCKGGNFNVESKGDMLSDVRISWAFWRRRAGLVILLAIVALVVRLPGLGDFMTADEQNWMLRSGEFWHKLFRQGDPGGTFLTSHPGVTAMWLAGAGIAVQEARLGFDVDEGNLRDFRLAATLPVVLATASLIGLAAWLLIKLLGLWPGAMAGLVLALDPYLTGMSQIVHLDALLALLMLASTLSFLLSLQRGQRYLWPAGVFAGLALATKLLPALWLFIFWAAVLLVKRVGLREWVRVMGFAGGVAALVFYIVWPALWAQDVLLIPFTRDLPAVVTQEHVALELSADKIEPASFYGRTLLGRTTPFVLILMAGALAAGVKAWWREKKLPLLLWLLFYVAGYLILITLVAKKADRYALPALAVLPAVAGWMFGAFAQNVGQSWQRLSPFLRRPTLVAVSVGLLLFSQMLIWSPYAIAYNNPFFPSIRPSNQQGWGEGLDAAARWLNESPLIDRLTVASWYPSVFGTYFNGKTMSLSSRQDDRVGYVVLYRNMLGRAPDDIASNVLDEFEHKQPVRVFSIQGVPYAAVYEQLGPHYFNQHVGELVGEMEVGQIIPVNTNNWSAVGIVLSNFSGRDNTEDVILRIKADPEMGEALRTVRVNASRIEDGAWQRFEFEPIMDAAGKSYYVSVTSPESTQGNAITIRFANEDILPGRFLLRRRALSPGEKNSSFLRDGDMAYRIE